MSNKALVEKKNLIAGLRPRIEEILPKHLTPERAIRIYQNAISRNPRLLQCSDVSLCEAIITASEFGLEPNTPLGQCFLIPYGKDATFQVGYEGLKELAYRSGRVSVIYAEEVRENDVFEIVLGLERNIVHKPAMKDRGEPTGYYGVVKMKDSNEPLFAWMTVEEIEAHAGKYSFAYKQKKKDSPWFTNFPAMAKKTVIIQALKTAPKSIDDKLMKAIYEDPDTEFPEQETKRRNTSMADFKDKLREGKEPQEIADVDPDTGEVEGYADSLRDEIEQLVVAQGVTTSQWDAELEKLGIPADLKKATTDQLQELVDWLREPADELFSEEG